MTASVRALQNKDMLSTPEEEFHLSGHNAYASEKQEILDQLDELGINSSSVKQLSARELSDLLIKVQDLLANSQPKLGRSSRYAEPPFALSITDKKILLMLFSSGGHISSLTLSRQLGIPLSTIQRRRKKLESAFVDRHYSLKSEKFGWRTASLSVETASTSASVLGKKILATSDFVMSVVRTIGEAYCDLRVEVVFKSNQDLLMLVDLIKGMEGVRSVHWSESVAILGRKLDYFEKILGSS